MTELEKLFQDYPKELKKTLNKMSYKIKVPQDVLTIATDLYDNVTIKCSQNQYEVIVGDIESIYAEQKGNSIDAVFGVEMTSSIKGRVFGGDTLASTCSKLLKAILENL